MVVIVGGANERGDYVSSTMLLNIVTRQVWAPSIGNYWEQKTNSNYVLSRFHQWLNQVTKGGDMALPRFEHGVAFVGEQLLVFGGFDTAYNCLTEVGFL